MRRSILSRPPVEDLARRLGLFAPLARSIPSRSPVEDLARRLGLFAPLALIGGRPQSAPGPSCGTAAAPRLATSRSVPAGNVHATSSAVSPSAFHEGSGTDSPAS